MTRQRLLNKLLAVADAHPATNLGALIEAVEECAWDTLPQRHCSMRLMNMSDELLERGIDAWMQSPGVSATKWKS